jgi:SAM-dependent methyltransferase
VTWRDHPLCAPAATMPDRFWGPEQFDPTAWRELAALLSPEAEIAAILGALGDSADCVDVGGGTGLITQAIAGRMPVLVIEPAAEQRAHLPPNIMVRAGRIEALPLHDGAYDAAVATWVLQYADDPMRAVAELARVARRRVVIVQAAPGNDLVDIWNLEASIAGMPPAHHGYLLSHAAAILERAGFDITLERVAVAVPSPSGAHALADTFARMHFSAHPKCAEILAATEPVIAKHLASKGMVSDDAVVLTARRS